jgi:hypothetical protein
MRDLLVRARCEAPRFSFTGFFDLTLPRRTKRGQVAGQVGVGVGPRGNAILAYCSAPRSLKKILARTGIRKRDNLTPHLKRLIDAGFLTQTLPGRPRSRFQKYVTTEAGRKRLEGAKP